jgi:hypothetical protein
VSDEHRVHRRRWVVGALVTVSVSCAARKPAPPTPDPREGKTSYRIIPPAGGGGAGSVEAAETITAAYASSDNRPPEYPAYALKAGCREGSGMVPRPPHRWEQTPIEIYVDFEFLFRVEQGKGVVRSK